MITTLGVNVVGNRILNKPQKIYLNNTNLSYTLGKNTIDIGTIRETFFLNQLSVSYSVSYPKTVDFMIDNEFLFEVGGKNKKTNQTGAEENALFALDNIETGFGNKIPLWLFGFLY